MKASKVIEKLQELIKKHGDLYVLDQEDNDYSIGHIFYNAEYDIFENELHDSRTDDDDYPLNSCDECCNVFNKTEIVNRYNGYDHKACCKCFFNDFEYEIYSEQAHIIDADGKKIDLIIDSVHTEDYFKYKQKYYSEY